MYTILGVFKIEEALRREEYAVALTLIGEAMRDLDTPYAPPIVGGVEGGVAVTREE